MLVVDCPSRAFLPALTSSPQLSECASGAKQDKGAPPGAYIDREGSIQKVLWLTGGVPDNELATGVAFYTPFVGGGSEAATTPHVVVAIALPPV